MQMEKLLVRFSSRVNNVFSSCGSRMRTEASAAIVLTLAIHGTTLSAQQQEPLHVSSRVLKQYEGKWVYPAGNSVMVILSGDTLYRETGGQRIPLVPISDKVFKLGPVFTAEFVMDQAGGITQIVSDGVATEFHLTREGSPPASSLSAPAASIHVPRSVLERYVGEYEYFPGQMSRTDLKVIVRLKGDTLLRSVGGPTEDVLTPISTTRFRVGNTLLVTEFVMDQAGGVTQILGTGDRQMRARLKAKS